MVKENIVAVLLMRFAFQGEFVSAGEVTMVAVLLMRFVFRGQHGLAGR